MKKSIRFTLLVIFILLIVCVVCVIWHPWTRTAAPNAESSAPVSSTGNVQDSSRPAESAELTSSAAESSALTAQPESSQPAENVSETSIAEGLVPEDQPDEPDLNFETSGQSYDDIMVNVLTCLLSKDMNALSSYVGSQGLRLSPTGICSESDVVLSADEVSSFFSLGSMSYGTYPGSGEDMYYAPDEYYSEYLYPSEFDFSVSSVAYNDAEDLAAVNGLVSNAKTVSYYYAPNIMEWQRLIFVYGAEGSGDALCAIIYQDLTTN